ncbi:ATP carrier protein 1, partial [Striga asiatica]
WLFFGTLNQINLTRKPLFQTLIQNFKDLWQNLHPSPKKKPENYPLCRAEAAAASSDGQSLNGEKKEPKFMGIEIVTLKKILPLGMMIWSFCMFYVMAELWGSVVVSVLFWGFANQAKKFDLLFGLGANVALIFLGRTVKYFSQIRQNSGPSVDSWAISLKGMMRQNLGPEAWCKVLLILQNNELLTKKSYLVTPHQENEEPKLFKY